MTVRAESERRNGVPLEPIAIVGMACLFPQAPDLAAFWRNIVSGVDAVGEPQAAWDAERYLRTGRIKTASGGYLKELFRFDPREFGIMPNSLDGGEPDQFVALRVARDALADAGYLGDHDHRDTGIVLGHSTYLHRGQAAILQNTLVLDQTMELLATVCPALEPARLDEIRALMKAKLPPSNADIAPGLVPNVMTGRIANRLNLKGPNYLLDAACSSSLLAVNAAIDELRSGRSRMMLAGGVNASLPAEVALIFTQLGALSGRGKVRPFATGSDGTLLGEGLGVVVLKRLDDALGDGDRIYAVLRGVGQASDGRGHGLLAPSVDGETLAIRRAYDSTGVDPASVTLVEAHGTGIPLGDKTEIAALKNVFGERRTAQGAIALGSVKSMISHCIPAAGIAGLIKTALAPAPPGAAADPVRRGQSRARDRGHAVLRQHRGRALDRPPGQRAPRRHRFVRLRRDQRPRDRRGGAPRRRSVPTAARPGPPSSSRSRRQRPRRCSANSTRSPRHSPATRRRRSPRSPRRSPAPIAASRCGSPWWPGMRSRS
jgi:acyl transferase domain-containing protein